MSGRALNNKNAYGSGCKAKSLYLLDATNIEADTGEGTVTEFITTVLQERTVFGEQEQDNVNPTFESVTITVGPLTVTGHSNLQTVDATTLCVDYLKVDTNLVLDQNIITHLTNDIILDPAANHKVIIQGDLEVMGDLTRVKTTDVFLSNPILSLGVSEGAITLDNYDRGFNFYWTELDTLTQTTNETRQGFIGYDTSRNRFIFYKRAKQTSQEVFEREETSTTALDAGTEFTNSFDLDVIYTKKILSPDFDINLNDLNDKNLIIESTNELQLISATDTKHTSSGDYELTAEDIQMDATNGIIRQTGAAGFVLTSNSAGTSFIEANTGRVRIRTNSGNTYGEFGTDITLTSGDEIGISSVNNQTYITDNGNIDLTANTTGAGGNVNITANDALTASSVNNLSLTSSGGEFLLQALNGGTIQTDDGSLCVIIDNLRSDAFKIVNESMPTLPCINVDTTIDGFITFNKDLCINADLVKFPIATTFQLNEGASEALVIQDDATTPNKYIIIDTDCRDVKILQNIDLSYAGLNTNEAKDIIIAAAQSEALRFIDTSNIVYMTFDSSAQTVRINSALDFSGGTPGTLSFKLGDNDPYALIIKDCTNGPYMTFDTSNTNGSGYRVLVNKELHVSGGVIDTSGVVTDLVVKSNDSDSFEIKDDLGISYLSIDSTTGSEIIKFNKDIDFTNSTSGTIKFNVGNSTALNFTDTNDDPYIVFDSSSGGDIIFHKPLTFLDAEINMENEVGEIKLIDGQELALNIKQGNKSFVVFNTDTDRFEIRTHIDVGFQDTCFYFKNETDTALTFKDRDNNEYLVFNTNRNVIEFQRPIDFTSGPNQLNLAAGEMTSFSFMQDTTSYLVFNTASPSVIINQKLDIDTPTIDLVSQSTCFSLAPINSSALEFKDGASTMLTFDTLLDTIRLHVPLDTSSQTAAEIKVVENQTKALSIIAGTTTYISINTNNDVVEIDSTLSVASHEAELILGNSLGSALTIKDDSGIPKEYLVFRTSGSDEKIFIKQNVIFEANEINFSSQATTFKLLNGNNSALSIVRGTDNYLIFDTDNTQLAIGQDINVSTGGTTKLIIDSNNTTGFIIEDDTGDSCITFDTNTPKIIFNKDVEITGGSISGVALGPFTSLGIDDLFFDEFTISTINAKDLYLSPVTGIIYANDILNIGIPNTGLSFNNNVISTRGSSSNIELSPNGSGNVVINDTIQFGNPLTGTNTMLLPDNLGDALSISSTDGLKYVTFITSDGSERTEFPRRIVVTNTFGATDKDTGALIVEGGVGIEENLYVGGTINTGSFITINGTTGTILTNNSDLTLDTSVGSKSVIINSVDIGGGEIDNTPIGVSTASTGRFTDLTITGAFNLAGSTTFGNIDISGNTISSITGKIIFNSDNNIVEIISGDELNVDVINETSANIGVTIEEVLIKDNVVTTNVLNSDNIRLSGSKIDTILPSTNLELDPTGNIILSKDVIIGDIVIDENAHTITTQSNMNLILSADIGGQVIIDSGKELQVDTINDFTGSGVNIEGVILDSNTLTASSQINSGNIRISGNMIESINMDGNINLIPNNNGNITIKNRLQFIDGITDNNKIIIPDSKDDGLSFEDTNTSSYLSFNTNIGSESVIIEQKLDIDNALIDVTSQATTIQFLMGSTFTIQDSMSNFIIFDSSVATDTITMSKFTQITDTTASTNSSTGALVVSGGIGVTGNINASGTIQSGNSIIIDGTGTTGTHTISTTNNYDLVIDPGTGKVILGSSSTGFCVDNILISGNTISSTSGDITLAPDNGSLTISGNLSLNQLTIDEIFIDNSTITFNGASSGDNIISIPDNQDSALVFSENGTEYLKFNTSNSGESVKLLQNLDLTEGPIEIIAPMNEEFALVIKDNTSSMGDQKYITFDTRTTGDGQNIKFHQNIDVSSDAIEFKIMQNNNNAFVINDSASNTYLTFDTSGTPNIIFHQNIYANVMPTDFVIKSGESTALIIKDDTDDYITFNTSGSGNQKIHFHQDFDTTALAMDWTLVSGQSSALLIKDAGANNYLTFDTNSPTINVHQNMDTTGQSFKLSLDPTNATSFTIDDGTNNFMVFDTSATPKIIIDKNLDFSNNMALEFTINYNEPTSMKIKDVSGNDYIIINTTATPDSMANLFPITLGTNVSITGATDSTSSTTGALIVAGGIGISGSANINGTITSGSSIIIDGTTPGSHNIKTTGNEALTINPGTNKVIIDSGSAGLDVGNMNLVGNVISSTESITLTPAINEDITLNTTGTGTVNLSSLTIDQVNINDSTLTFSGTNGNNMLVFPDTIVDAFTLTDGTNEYLTFDTSNDKIIFNQNIDIDANSIDLVTQNTTITMASSITALTIKENTDDYIVFDTSSKKIIIGQNMDINAETIDISNQNTELIINTDASALTIKDNTNTFMTFDSNGSIITINSTTTSSNSSEGSLIIEGGLGVKDNINAAGTITSGNSIIIDGNTIGNHSITTTSGESLTIGNETDPVIISKGFFGSNSLFYKEGDNTSILQFDLSDIPTSTMITFKVPNMDTDLVGTTIPQTLTNKTFGDNLDMGTFKIVNIGDPTNPKDVANKDYVDLIAAGLNSKDAVRVATTMDLDSNGSISGTITYTETGGTSGRGDIMATLSGSVFTVDGIDLNLNDRLLLKDQSVPAQNGIWFVQSITAFGILILERATDFDSDSEVNKGAHCFVEEGVINAYSGWILTTENDVTVGGTSGSLLMFSKFSGTERVIAGSGLTKTIETLSVNIGSTMLIDSDALVVNSSSNIGEVLVSQGLTSTPAVYEQLILTNTKNTFTGLLPLSLGGTGVDASGFTGNRIIATNVDSTVFTETSLDPTNVVTNDGTETLSNKTFDDTTTYFHNTTTNSKRVRFDLSSLSGDNTILLPTGITDVVGTNLIQTLTNKTIDLDGTGNTIENIADTHIKLGAAIDTIKLADGTVSNAAFQRLGFVNSDIVGITDVQTLSNKSFNTNVNMNGRLFNNLGNPVFSTDSATKGYVDGMASGLDIKESVRVATTQDISDSNNNGNMITYTIGPPGSYPAVTIEGTMNLVNDQITIDGVVLTNTDVGTRILIKDQDVPNSKTQNGIYTLTSISGANFVLTRASDYDETSKISTGSYVFVEEGDTNANTGFVLVTQGTITLDTTELEYTIFSKPGSVLAGDGMTKIGNTINVIGSDTILANADSLEVKSSGTEHQVLLSVGNSNLAAAYGQVRLDQSTAVSGTLPLSLGGTGVSVFSTPNALVSTNNDNDMLETVLEISDVVTETSTHTLVNKKFGDDLDMCDNRIINVNDPIDSNDAANKQYVDDMAIGSTEVNNLIATKISYIDPVIVASTINIDDISNIMINTVNDIEIKGTFSGSISIDGILLSDGNRILLKDQTNGSENGIWEITISGASFTLDRPTDYMDNTTIKYGSHIYVQKGLINANKGWVLTTTGTVTVGTTVLTYTQFSGVFPSSFSSGNRLVATNATNDALEATSLIASDIATKSGSETFTNKTWGDTLNMGDYRISFLGEPVDNTDATTKSYVDNLTSTSVNFIELPVSTATSSESPGNGDLNSNVSINGTISYVSNATYNDTITATLETSGEFIVDTVVFNSPSDIGKRILLKNQLDARQNGIWIINTLNAEVILERANDFKGTNVLKGAHIYVEDGVENGQTGWIITNSESIIVGGSNTAPNDATPLTFKIFSDSKHPTTGAGLLISGDELSIDLLNSTTIFVDGSTGLEVKSSTTAGQVLVSQGSGKAEYGQLSLTNSNNTFTDILPVSLGGTGSNTLTNNKLLLSGSSFTESTLEESDIITLTGTQTLTNKTLTLPKISDATPGGDTFNIIGAELTSGSIDVTLPALTANDEFVFKNYTQTLTNKTIDLDVSTNNTISNITNNHIKSDANIEITKLAGNVTAMEFQQLETLGTTVISSSQWVNLSNMDQDVATTSSVTFDQITTDNIVFNGTNATNIISFPDELGEALTFAEGTNKYMIFITETGSEKVEILTDLHIEGNVTYGNSINIDGTTLGDHSIKSTPGEQLTLEAGGNLYLDTTALTDFVQLGPNTAGFQANNIQLSGNTISSLSGDLTLSPTGSVVVNGNISITGTVDGVDISDLKADVDGFPDALKTLTSTEIGYISGIMSAIVGVDDSQILNNKTLIDNTTYFQDETDSNKKMQFQLSGITGTNIVTLPDGNFVMVGEDLEQTLSQKTLITPKIQDSNASHTYDISVSNLTDNRTITLPLLTANDIFVFEDHNQTLSNKTLVLPKIYDSDSSHTYNIITPDLTSGSVDIYLPDLSAIDTFVFESHQQTLQNKILIDANTYIKDQSTSGQIMFNVTGTTGTKTISVPHYDMTLVGEDTSQTLTNKTINAGSNTITGLTNSDVGLDFVQNIKSNFTAITDPGLNDDQTDDYSIGSLWVNTSTNTTFICTNAGTGSANWKECAIVHTASNLLGTSGIGIFKQKTSNNFEFKKLKAASTKVSIVDNIGNNEVDIDIVENSIIINNLNGAPTGAVVGETDSQTLTNKTLESAVFQNNNTLGTMRFDLSSIPFGTQGVISIPTPTTNFTLVGEDTTQTLTNKTIVFANNNIVIDKDDIGLNNVENTKNFASGSADPNINNDSSEGYSIGSIWTNTMDDIAFICLDASVGAAVWKDITQQTSTSVGESNTVSNLGGIGLFSNKSDVDLQFKGITSGTPTVLTIIDNPSTIELDIVLGNINIFALENAPTSFVDETSLQTLTNKSFIDNLTNFQYNGNPNVKIQFDLQDLSPITNIIKLPSDITEIVGKTTTQTLTNKTIDLDGTGNTIENITDTHINLNANINAEKLGTGVVTNTEFNRLNGLTSAIVTENGTQTLTDKILSETTVIKDVTNNKIIQFDFTNITNGTTRTVSFPNSDILLVGRDTTQTLTNKTIDIDAGSNIILNISDSNIKSGANININKLGTGDITTTEFNQLSGITSTVVGISDTQILINKKIGDNLDMCDNRIINIADPINLNDAVNKGYVDAAISGLVIKTSVRVATSEDLNIDTPNTINGTVTYMEGGGPSLTGTIEATLQVNNQFIIDNVTLTSADNGVRILIKDQANHEENGVYTMEISGVLLNELLLTRAPDFDTDDKVQSGSFFFVEEGTENANNGFTLITNNPITVGTASGSDLVFSQFTGAGQVVAGDGLLFQNSGGNYTARISRGDQGSSEADLVINVGNNNTDVTALPEAMRIKYTNQQVQLSGGISTGGAVFHRSITITTEGTYNIADNDYHIIKDGSTSATFVLPLASQNNGREIIITLLNGTLIVQIQGPDYWRYATSATRTSYTFSRFETRRFICSSNANSWYSFAGS